ncbi:hypothetical protein GUJ93_ZPchr0001g30435 [Zizania palustris]|uniref:Glycosyltransferase n=1 Tax=Zizania palustris TaxID=103762 RepID=A0A8J5RRH1_ZIZPA|nr:hypothetical protein GUJ93_ZPchr0001g30435 [Zizania palustris]
MDASSGSMHVAMLPWLAFGHILPFAEFAKRVARQGHRVTLFSTPRNTRRLIDVPPALAGRIRVVDISLPRDERLPENAEATIDLPSDDLRPYMRRAYDDAFVESRSPANVSGERRQLVSERTWGMSRRPGKSPAGHSGKSPEVRSGGSRSEATHDPIPMAPAQSPSPAPAERVSGEPIPPEEGEEPSEDELDHDHDDAPLRLRSINELVDDAPISGERFRRTTTAFARELSRLLQETGPSRPDWVLVDYAAYWAPEAAARYGVPCAFLSLFGAAALSFLGPAEALMGRGKYAKTEPAHLTVVPDFVPFPTTVAFRGYEARELFKPGMIPDDSGVSESYRFGKSIDGCQLVAVRSSREFEPEWLQLLGEIYQKPVIPIGMFPPPPSEGFADHEETLRWLDRQAPNSVVYAAFGSEVKLTSAQLQIIALGLEASGLPFIGAFRPPADAGDGNGTDGCPEGFEERVNGRGVVCRGWVPQVRFLAHGSVGGFLTHAGWNSIAEGLAQGVRLVLLPLVFDQGLNARHLAEKKVAVEVSRNEDDGAFTAKDIADALKRVMVEEEGEEFGIKARELAEVFGNDEVNDHYVQDFLRCLSEYKMQQEA